MCDYLLSLLCELQKGKCVGQDRSGLFFSNKLLQNVSGLIEKKKKRLFIILYVQHVAVGRAHLSSYSKFQLIKALLWNCTI